MMLMWLLILHYISVATAQAPSDCEELPQYSKILQCCKFPVPKWTSYATECSQHIDGAHKFANPCIMDCIFNVSQVLENDVVNMANARNMISKLYEGSPDFIQAYSLGFEKCQQRVKQKLDQFKNTERPSRFTMRGPSKCRPLAMLYALCSHKEAFANCPSSAWTSSKECDNAKNFALNCDYSSLRGKKRSKFVKPFRAT